MKDKKPSHLKAVNCDDTSGGMTSGTTEIFLPYLGRVDLRVITCDSEKGCLRFVCTRVLSEGAMKDSFALAPLGEGKDTPFGKVPSMVQIIANIHAVPKWYDMLLGGFERRVRFTYSTTVMRTLRRVDRAAARLNKMVEAISKGIENGERKNR